MIYLFASSNLTSVFMRCFARLSDRLGGLQSLIFHQNWFCFFPCFNDSIVENLFSFRPGSSFFSPHSVTNYAYFSYFTRKLWALILHEPKSLARNLRTIILLQKIFACYFLAWKLLYFFLALKSLIFNFETIGILLVEFMWYSKTCLITSLSVVKHSSEQGIS